ncbi:putative Suppressor protein SRP40 [Candidatus Terasakiella magnetica]|nr:putative Suppressor protein SRP40 [Candidatus Terasakiella magnetica]
MSITGISSQSQHISPQARLLGDLEKNGLSADKAAQVSSEIETAVKSVASASGSDRPNPTDVRAAIEKQLKADVQNGKITASDADTIRTTLDKFEQQMGQGAPAGGPPPGGGQPPTGGSGSGGGGGGGSASGTSTDSTSVVSTTSSTSADGVTTTVTTYADGTKTTKTTRGAANKSAVQSLQDILNASSQDGTDSKATSDYLTKLLTSGLVNTTA